MPLAAQVALSILAHETSSGDLSRTLRSTPVNHTLSLADGTGANQAQVVWSDTRTATTSNDTLSRFTLPDVRDGVAANVLVDTLKLLYIHNKSSSVSINASAAGWTVLPSASHKIRPGGALLVTAPGADGYAPTGLGDSITISTGGGTAEYDIVIIGEGNLVT